MPKIIWINGKGKTLKRTTNTDTERFRPNLDPTRKQILATWKEPSKSSTRNTVARVRGDQPYKDAAPDARWNRSTKYDRAKIGVLSDGKGLIPYQKAIARFKHEHRHCLRRNGTPACKVRALDYCQSKTWITQKAVCSVCNTSVSFLYDRKPKVESPANTLVKQFEL